MVRVYAVASAKGGVGKTTTTANLGAALAAADRDVVVVDADISMANLGDALGVEVDGATVHDVLAGEAAPREAARDGPLGLTVVPGSTALDAFRDADPAELRRVVEAFDDADYVLLDVGAGLSHDTGVPLGLADSVLLVSTTERAALVDTDKTRAFAERLGAPVAGAVLTRVDPAEPNPEEIGDRLDCDVLEVVPEDPSVREALAAGEPVVGFDPESPASVAYRSLAATLADGAGVAADSEGEPEPEADPGEETAEAATPTDDDAADDDAAGDAATDDSPESAVTYADAEELGEEIPDAEAAAGAEEQDDEGVAEEEGAADVSFTDEAIPFSGGRADEAAAEDEGDGDEGEEVADESDDAASSDENDDADESENDDGASSDDGDGKKGLFGRLFR